MIDKTQATMIQSTRNPKEHHPMIDKTQATMIQMFGRLLSEHAQKILDAPDDPAAADQFAIRIILTADELRDLYLARARAIRTSLGADPHPTLEPSAHEAERLEFIGDHLLAGTYNLHPSELP